MSNLTRRIALTPHLDRIQIALDSLPARFVSRDNHQTISVLNALDAARDDINRAHKAINRALNQ